MQSSNGNQWVIPKIGIDVKITQNDGTIYQGQCTSFSMSVNPMDCFVKLENVCSNLMPGNLPDISIEISKIIEIDSSIIGANIMPKIGTKVRVSMIDGTVHEGICVSFSMAENPIDCMITLKIVGSGVTTFREKCFLISEINEFHMLPEISTPPAASSHSESSQTTWSCSAGHLCEIGHENWSEEYLKTELAGFTDLLDAMHKADPQKASSISADIYQMLSSKIIKDTENVVAHENMFAVECISIIFHNLMDMQKKCRKNANIKKEKIKKFITQKHEEMMTEERQKAAQRQVGDDETI